MASENSFAPGDLLTVSEVADLLRAKPSTIRAWLTQGKLPRVKIGRLTRVLRQDADAFIRAGRVVGGGQ
jgi:excisionase family DNA binding protein